MKDVSNGTIQERPEEGDIVVLGRGPEDAVTPGGHERDLMTNSCITFSGRNNRYPSIFDIDLQIKN